MRALLKSCHPMSHLAIGHNDFGFFSLRNVCLWDTLVSSSNSLIHAFTCHDHGATVLQYAPKHQLLISGGRKGYICIFDIRQRQILFTFQAHESAVKALALDPSEDYFVTGSAEGNMKVRHGGAGFWRRVFGWSSVLSYRNSQINAVIKQKQSSKPQTYAWCIASLLYIYTANWNVLKYTSRFFSLLKNRLLKIVRLILSR